MSDHRPIAADDSHYISTGETDRQMDDFEAWGSLYSLLAEGLKHPDERFYSDVREGRFAAELTQLTETLSVPLPPGSKHLNTVPETRAGFDSEYIALFEGLATPYAPLVESVYRPWYGGPASDGLLSGPAAADMRHRYDAAGISIPTAYAPDHLALLLEYAGILCRATTDGAYVTFIEQHLDWLPALRRLVDDAAANSPFHEYCIAVTCEAVAVVRDREGLTSPNPDAVVKMCDCVREHVE